MQRDGHARLPLDPIDGRFDTWREWIAVDAAR